MAEFRWMKTYFSLIMLLQFTAAATGQQPTLTVRVEDDVTLPCENMIDDQVNCDGTTWLFSEPLTSPGVLVNLGKIVENAKSDRLSVTEKCALVIQKVTYDDVGYYSCRQYHKSGKQGHFLGYEMSVLKLSAYEDIDEVTFHCFVLTNIRCTHRVKWLFQSQDVGKDHPDIRASQSLCSASVTFPTSHYIYTSRYKLFTCAVTDGDKVQEFPFSSQSSGEDTITATTESTTTENSTAAGNTTPASAKNDASPKLQACTAYWSALDYIMLVMRVAELLLITVITVLLFRARGNQRPPDDNTVNRNGNGQDVTVNYENVRDPSVSVRLP